MKKRKKSTWLDEIREVAYKKPLAILRFDEDEWGRIINSHHGASHFTIARPHELLEHVRTPTACILIVDKDGTSRAFLALLQKRAPATTLDTRLTIEHAHRISPTSESELAALVTDSRLAANLRKRLAEDAPVIPLSPMLSAHLIEKLAEIERNRAVIQSLIASLDRPKKYSSNASLQEDAIRVALRTFGIGDYDPAELLEIAGDRETALAGVSILEDAVIEHDARAIAGLTLASSDLTGRAVFRNGNERLEVITANKRPLERVLGVDLIYLNVIQQNIVMVQYKMLELDEGAGKGDWVYRPDKQFAKEITRMKRFSGAHPPCPLEYRINPQVFYLKFVRRDAELGRSSITMPIDHYEVLRKDPRCKGTKGAFRISYMTLNGRYLRQEPFTNLIRSGYIGAHAQTTADLSALVDAILKDGHAVVAAIHSRKELEDESQLS